MGAGRGGWGAGLRFVPPKAEAERQGLLLMRRSKNRASEQREDFFRAPQGGKDSDCSMAGWKPGSQGASVGDHFSKEASPRMGWKMWKTDGKGRVLGHLCGEKRPLTVENCVKSGENLYRMGGFIECKIMRRPQGRKNRPLAKPADGLFFRRFSGRGRLSLGGQRAVPAGRTAPPRPQRPPARYSHWGGRR